jgi:hypothetical protein
MKRTIIAVSLGAALLTLPYIAYAHHAFNAEYDSNKVMTMVGTITKVDQQNPHGWFYMDVKPATPGGRVINWALETPGPNQLVVNGFTKAMYEEIVAKKEVVTVKAYAAKDGSKHAFAETLTRADNRTVINISNSGVAQVGGLRGGLTAGQNNITVDGQAVDQGGGTARGGAAPGGRGGGVGGRGGGVGGGGGAPRGGGGAPGAGAGGAPRGAAPVPGGGN